MLTSEFLSGYLRNADDSFHEDVPEAEPEVVVGAALTIWFSVVLVLGAKIVPPL